MNIFKNSKQYDIKKAFTLIEVMLLLVVLSLVFASSTTIITRKHKLKPRRSVHGTYICYRNNDDGLLHEIMYSGKSLIFENNQTVNPAFTECKFEAPKNASYLYVQLIGGGGAGGNANQNVDTEDVWTGLNDTTTGVNRQVLTRCPDGKYSYVDDTYCSSVLSLLKDNTSTGLTEDYIHGFKFDDVSLSVKWLRKFFKDNNFKFAVYDYAGSGAAGGKYKQNYLMKSQNEKSDTDDADVFYWYDSYCQYSGGSTTGLTPEDCLKRLKSYSISFAVDSSSSKMLQYKDYSNASGAGSYCQQRPPLYKNCPWLLAKYWPREETISCDGGLGGKGGLLVSPLFDYDLGYSYKLGKRYALTPSGDADVNKTIDWDDPIFHTPDFQDKYKGEGVDCLVGIKIGIDYIRSYPGTLLTYDEACPDGTNCKDIEGVPIQSAEKTSSGYIASSNYDAYFKERVKVCDKDEEGNDILDTCTYEYVDKLGMYGIFDYYGEKVNSLYFKEYPVVNLFKSYDPRNCIQRETDQYGASRGLDGGLPYFENAFGVKNGEGLKVCKNNVCNLYSTTNPDMTDSSSFAPGKGGLGGYSTRDLLTDDLTLVNPYADPDSYCASKTEEEPLGLKGKSGSSTMKKPTGSTYMRCSGPYAVAYGPLQQGDGDLVASSPGLVFNDTNYDCPRPKYVFNTNLDIGITLAHYSSKMQLYYGERGSAGSYKTLFARSFGTAGLKLNPGRGGTAFEIDPGSTVAGNNGEATILETACDENNENCDVKIQASGGIGGRSHVGMGYDYIRLSNKDIYDYAHDRTKAPEAKYSSNYEDNSYLGEESEFQEISFLSDLSLIENGEVVSHLGNGGNGGWVRHDCFLRPQYFTYHYEGYGLSYDPTLYNVEIPNVEGDTYTPQGSHYDPWEGYTNFSQAVINNLEVCTKNGKTPEEQYEETAATNGYPGAVVIMW